MHEGRIKQSQRRYLDWHDPFRELVFDGTVDTVAKLEHH